MEVVGEKAGLGRNVNIPWPCGGMGDAEYLYAFNRVITPILTEFQPEMIIGKNDYQHFMTYSSKFSVEESHYIDLRIN